MRILVVDDDIGTLNALRAHLASSGHQALIARGGSEALSLIEASVRGAEPIDLMVTDFRMRGMNGLELIRAARRSAPCLPAILMTAYGHDSLRRRAVEEGANGCLDKPFSPEKLMFEIRSLVQCPGTGC